MTPPVQPPPDRGIQNERTALAWQRTALAVAAACIATARLSFDEIGWLAMVNVVAAFPLSVWVLLESGARYRRRTGLPRPVGGVGIEAALLCGAVSVLAVTELVALVRS